MATRNTAQTNPADWDERTRKSMLWTGILFIGTFVFSIPALFFYSPMIDHKDYVLGGGHDTRVTVGALFEIILIVCNAGTAITLYPVARRFTETAAIGYVASRLFESVMIALGVLSLMAVVTLRQDFGGATAADPLPRPPRIRSSPSMTGRSSSAPRSAPASATASSLAT